MKILKNQGFVNDKFQLVDKQGNVIDEDGRKLNEAGRYVNDQNQYVDSNGDQVDEDGNYVVEFEPFQETNVVSFDAPTYKTTEVEAVSV